MASKPDVGALQKASNDVYEAYAQAVAKLDAAVAVANELAPSAEAPAASDAGSEQPPAEAAV